MSKPKVFIAAMTLVHVDGAYRRVLREAGFELILSPKAVQLTEDELIPVLDGVAASFAGTLASHADDPPPS